MSESEGVPVPAELVDAAIRASEELQLDVADVPIIALAEAAGLSRSTLLRRIGGSRRALNEAVRAAGVDPGGRVPVRERAIEAAMRLISEQGLAAATLEAVAAAAECSVHSVYVTFGGRDGLLSAVYESHTPLFEIEELLDLSSGDLRETVTGVYRTFASRLGQAQQLVPAMLADAVTRPGGAAAQLIQRYFPRALGSLGGWLAREVAAGRVRPLPPVLLLQQFLGPLMVHLLTRPVITRTPGAQLPDLDEVCAVFAETFVRAVGVPETHRNEVS